MEIATNKQPKIYFNDEAEMFAYKAWDTLKLEPPIDLDLVAKKLKIEIHEESFVDEIDGFYLRLNNIPPIIALNNSFSKSHLRKRFTFAHEIGHHLLGRNIVPGKRLFFIDTNETRRSILEKACDRFAAMLLMPEELVKKQYDDLAYNKEMRVKILSDRFEVSETAMRRRLKELNLPVSRYKY